MFITLYIEHHNECFGCNTILISYLFDIFDCIIPKRRFFTYFFTSDRFNADNLSLFFSSLTCSNSPLVYELLCSAKAAGLLTIKMTESPLRNILETYRSLLMAIPRVFPLPPLLCSVHISFTSSSNLKHNEK